MFSVEDLERIKKKICQLNISTVKNNDGDQKERSGGNENNGKACPSLNPPEILAIAGLLSGVLEVSSVLVSRDQTVEVSLVGSLKRQTQLEKIMEQIGKLSFEEVMQAMLNGIK